MNVGSLSSARRWFIFVWIIAILPHGAAFAEEPTLVEFDIAAQDLGDALTEFGVQSGTEVYFVSADVAGVQAPRIEGKYSEIDVIRQLLGSSGVEYFIDGNGTLLVGTAYTAVNTSDERGASDPKNLTPQPILMAQNQTSTTQTTSNRSNEGGTSIVTGKVTDARTGANLKGAKVTIEETGQWTSTNDLGEFRFVNVPTGSATLTVSYVGYAAQSTGIAVYGDGTSQDFALRGGSEIDEIVVYGSRSARAQSLNQERVAPNSTIVLAADFLGQFDGTTVAESLRRAPGVAFEQDPLTGDGTNIIVRGLDPDLNQVTLNGLRLPDGSGIGRSANLSNILTESISKITISKTLLPSQDSSGAGGLIEIETKGPLDRPRRFASLNLEGGRSGGEFVEDSLVSGTVSGLFGALERSGLSASFQYREREIDQISYSVGAGPGGAQFFPLASDGSPIVGSGSIDPRNSFPFGQAGLELYPDTVSNSFNSATTSNLSIGFSAETLIGDHTKIGFDVNSIREERDSFSRSLNITPLSSRQVLPIDDLGGEQRAALVFEGLFSGFGFPEFFLSPTQRYNFSSGVENNTDLFTLRGQTNTQRWTLDYSMGYATAETSEPLSGSLVVGRPFAIDTSFVDRGLFTDQALQNTVSGLVVSPYAPLGEQGYPLPLLTEAGFGFYNNPQNWQVTDGSRTSGRKGENTRISFDFSARYQLQHKNLKYVEFGLFYDDAEFKNLPLDSNDAVLIFPLVATIADLDLEFSQSDLGRIGQPNAFDLVSEREIQEFYSRLDQNSDVFLFPLSSSDPRFQETFTREDNLSGYIQSQIDFGKLEIVGGFRFEQIEISAKNVRFPTLFEAGVPDIAFQERFSDLVVQEAEQFEIIPRLALTHRHTDNLLFRGGYSVAIGRPQIQNLSTFQNVFVDLDPVSGPNGDQPFIQVSQGNPDLEPAKTVSFDLSGEYYFDEGGQIEVSLFYKELENLLEFNNVVGGLEDIDPGVLPADDRITQNLEDFFIQVSQPQNTGSDSTIWGLEVTGERQLTFLPGIWQGLGVSANYTYTDSSKDQRASFLDPLSGELITVVLSDVPFNGDPEHSGTLALTYNKYGLDASLAYTFQDRRLSVFGPSNLSIFDESDDSLDFRAEYQFDRFGSNFRVWLEGSDLLKGKGDADVETSLGGTGATPKFYTGGNYFGGRVLRIGAGFTF